MYLAYCAITAGEFFLFGHILLLAYFLFFIVFFHSIVVFVEEPELEKRFGEPYVNYKKTVPRWVLF
jgi:protein-S-isoprenylcysteine O-methyltransferase Ste14